MFWRGILVAMLLAGCAQLPLTPRDLQARKFEAVPGKAVIYIVRDQPDLADAPATISLGDKAMVTTYPGTYYRWEVEPGIQRVAGFGADSGAISLETRPGTVYFVQQWLAPFPFSNQSHFRLVSEAEGRRVVMRSVLVGGE